MSLDTILDSVGKTIFRLAFEVSPIILTDGIAKNIPGNLLPIIAITEIANLLTGLLSGTDITIDNFFAHYKPLPGTTLIENQFGHYPFANQTVAANAIIRMPLRVSLMMLCPVRHAGGNLSKLLTFTALKAILDKHHAQGGTYTIATPSYIYQNCLLANLKDIGGEGAQAQMAWQWDFEQPLLTLAAAAQAQNDQMSKLGPNGTPSSGATSGLNTGSTGAGAGPAIIPTAGGTGAQVGTFPATP